MVCSNTNVRHYLFRYRLNRSADHGIYKLQAMMEECFTVWTLLSEPQTVIPYRHGLFYGALATQTDRDGTDSKLKHPNTVLENMTALKAADQPRRKLAARTSCPHGTAGSFRTQNLQAHVRLHSSLPFR
jgi:hypothetical protein